jgi:threonine dehydratase
MNSHGVEGQLTGHMHLALTSIQDARAMLAKHLSTTRLVEAPHLSKVVNKAVSLKLETELPTGSFKVRGAIYTLTLRLQRFSIEEVVASSTGNHGAAVAYAANKLGVRAKIFLPEGCNPVKRARIASLGAEIVEKGRDLSDACQLAMQECAENPKAFFLNDATDRDLPAATGVIGLEILEQKPQIQAIYVPIGDSALIRGIGAAVKQVSPHVKLIGVQAEQAPSYYLSWKSGKVVATDSCDTIADGLATRIPVPENVESIRELVDDVVLVSEDELLQAVDILLLEEHVLAEPAGAASTAAWLKSGSSQAGPDNSVLVVTGANISRSVLRQAIAS